MKLIDNNNSKYTRFSVKSFNRRQWAGFFVVLGSLFLVILALVWTFMPEQSYAIDYNHKYAAPSLSYLFGTDELGRDMFYRTLKGLALSIKIGLMAAFVSSCIALVLGTLSAVFGGKVDSCILWLIDLCLGIPHIILILMISVSLGGGEIGVTIGVIATHWAHLTRLMRAEIMQLRNQPYVHVARGYGHSYFTIGRKHFIPHVLPQYIIGLVLLLPHAILHEAGITFLGYGLPLDVPAIGIILSESMKHISVGMWWLGFFPGLLLMVIVLIFDRVGTALREILDPMRSQK